MLPHASQAPQQGRIVVAPPGPLSTVLLGDIRVPRSMALPAAAPPVRMADAGPPVGYLDPAEVRAFHARVGWDGGAAPGVWAFPAEFSDTD